MPAKIKVNSLSDMHQLLKSCGYPGEIRLPRQAYLCISDRTQPSGRQFDETGEFLWFYATKLRPPKSSEIKLAFGGTFLSKLSG